MVVIPLLYFESKRTKEKMRNYRIYAYHNEGYAPGFDELYVTEKGLNDFIKKFKSAEKECDETVSEEYIEYNKDWIEWQGFTIKWEEFKTPEFIDSIPSFTVYACESGYEATCLYIEER